MSRRPSLPKPVFIQGLFCLLCALAWGCDEGVPTVPLLTECAIPNTTRAAALGIGKDDFAAIDQIEDALIVGGYQGGHHLWAALRLPNEVRLEDLSRLHILACDGTDVAAEALYASAQSVGQSGQDLFGVPVVFGPNRAVYTLEGERLQLYAAVEDGETVYVAEGSVTLRCCGHVADGD